MRRDAIALLFVPAYAAACAPASPNVNCTSTGTITVHVSDDAQSLPICDAVVTATPAGGGAITFSVTGAGQACVYIAAVPPATYEIAVSKTGFSPQNSNLHIGGNGCNVDSPNLAFALVKTH